MQRLILIVTAGALILTTPALAVPIHVHKKVPVEREVVEHELVRGDPIVTTAVVEAKKTVVDVVHVAPRDRDDDGIADREDDCVGVCAPLEPVYVEETTTETYATGSSSSTGTSWDAVAACESSGDWSANTGNGYFGGLQFDSATWDAYGDPAYGEASDAPASAQIAAAEAMPYDGWPSC